MSIPKIRRPIKREQNLSVPAIYQVREMGYFPKVIGYFDT